MGKQRNTDKLKGNDQAGPKSRKPEDTNLCDINEPKTIAGNSENTSPRNELTKMAPNQVGKSIERIPARHLAPAAPSNKPTKIVLKDGATCFEGDESRILYSCFTGRFVA